MALGDRPGGKADLGWQGISKARLQVEFEEELVCRPGGNGGVHPRVLEDRSDGAHEGVSVEHGPVCPHDRGGQHDQETGKADQEADDRSAESPFPGGLQPFDLLGQRVPLRRQALDLLRRGDFGLPGLRAGIGIAHLAPTLGQEASMPWMSAAEERERVSSAISHGNLTHVQTSGLSRTRVRVSTMTRDITIGWLVGYRKDPLHLRQRLPGPSHFPRYPS